jgi:hypothetical protein
MSFNKNRDWTGNEEEYIQKCLEWLARHKAQLDQREKQFEDQYPVCHPRLNRRRLEDIEAKRLEIEVHEYELGGFIKDYIDSLEEE